ncbi:hypothetical protein CUC01_05255 [Akkermansia muciniphila]|nr:hypothetical protein CUB96_02085 [Akkermansia muciniphila]AYR32561.1 hypothetical protein CUC01_05255 [Akkermansia muciniphila]OUN28054.1 hypothetical protein B5G29_07905 [Akkermansia muciniphila]PNC85855.1 hypothetical protein CXT93_02080 [Akkermansia muciniphila]PND05429.1 hypothetical protein CXT86_04825 [Akkermansia muciniphila]
MGLRGCSRFCLRSGMSAFAGGLGERPSLFRQEEIMDKKIPSRHGGGKGGRKKGLIDQSWGAL